MQGLPGRAEGPEDASMPAHVLRRMHRLLRGVQSTGQPEVPLPHLSATHLHPQGRHRRLPRQLLRSESDGRVATVHDEDEEERV